MGTPAAKQNDRIVAIDTHLVQPTGPAPPVPTPCPFSGPITGGVSPNVLIQGLPAATVGSTAVNTPPHVPIGGAFVNPPTNQGQVISGSTTVLINGKAAARHGDTAQTCNDPVPMPVGTVVATSTVLIGGLTVAGILGSGWAFPVLPDANGALTLVSDEERIRQSIWLILATAPGERVMLPAFGCGIHDLVFQPNTVAVRGSVQAEVTDALTRWEPRIDVIGVTVTAPADQPEVMLIEIEYRLRATNAFYNLVYPLFISEGVAAGSGSGGAFGAT